MLPDCSSERSSSFSISSHRRVPASSTSSRTSATFSTSGSCASSVPAAVRIAVTGVRRSWETERSTAVFISSLRRSAAVSTISARRLSRWTAAARIEDSAGTTRSRARSRSAGDTPAGSSSAPIVSPPARSGSSAAASDGGASPRRIDAEGVPSACASRSAAGTSASCKTLGAEQQLRELACQRGLTAALVELTRARTRELGDQTDHDRDRGEGREADPVAPVAEREVTGRRQVEEVERGGAQDRRREPEGEAPEDRHDEHRQQVEDAERLDRRDVLERVHEQRREGDRRERHQHPERARRALGAKEAGRELSGAHRSQ